jgi:hypothetical protein
VAPAASRLAWCDVALGHAGPLRLRKRALRAPGARGRDRTVRLLF